MSSVEHEPIVTINFWEKEALSERIGAGLSFTIGVSGVIGSIAELTDSNLSVRILAIPAAIFAWEAFKLGFSELREANNIERETQTN